MENSNQDPTQGVRDLSAVSLDSAGGVHEAPDPNALSLDPVAMEQTLAVAAPGRSRMESLFHFVRRADVILILLLFVGAVITVVTIANKQEQKANSTSKKSPSAEYENIRLPLTDLNLQGSLSLAGPTNVTINGELQVTDSISLAPSLQPTGAKAGQIYFDQGTNQLAYYNGSGFVFLTSPSAEQGNIQTLTGVQSIGGAAGQLSLGSGLSVAGGQLANSGVLSVMGQAGDVTLTAGPGIVLNGTNFSNSGVISISAGSPSISVNNDGSGNVVIDVAALPGSGTVSSSGGTTGRVPLFTGAQNIEDSIITQSGLTVTINGDLSVVTGGLTLSNALTISNGGTGANSLATNGVLVGNGTAAISSVTAVGTGLCLLSTAGAPAWGVCPSAAAVTSLNGLTGALNIANASAAGATVTIDDATTSTKGIASFSGTNFTASGGAVNTIQDINSGATPTFAGVNTNSITPSAALTVGVSAQTALLQGSTTTITSNGAGNTIVLNSAATIELQDNTNVTGSVTVSGDVAVNGGDLTSPGALNITPGGALTVGATNQVLTLQGGATTSFRATASGNTTIVGFTSPTANTTLNFPALAAGTYTICTTSGNCSGAAATLQSSYDNSSSPEIVLDATRGALTIRDASAALGANLLEVQNNAGSITYLAVTASGAAVTGTLTASGNVNSTSGGIQTNGTTRVDNSGNLINIAAITTSGDTTIQGGTATLGTSSQAGSIVLNDGSSNTGTLQVAALGQNTVYTLPDPGTGTATICLTTGNCAGSGGGVTTGGGTTNRLAKFTGAQALGDSSIADDGTNVTITVDVIIQGGDLTMGTSAQRGSILLHDGNGQTTTLQAGDSAGNQTFVLPTNTGSANQCLKQSATGNQLVWQDCDGGLGGSSATLQTAYGNSTNPEITLNSSVGGLTIRDNSTPLGANLFEIQNNAGSTTYLAVSVSGASVTGTASATGNINTSGGTIQTNTTNRIDNSGNLVNIGNLTASGAMTIASVGAGNDITIDGADQFIVQDVATFNAATTFNASITIGANNITGTTGNIDLTNFDVVGSTGNVTAGTYNGQTISNTANFTGTVAIAGNTTLTGDVAVNGGDLTSTGALNITPGGTLTIGATGQQLILQGSANTQLTATGGGFTTTVGFAGSPTGAVVYNFDRAAAAGTYTICTSIGNCAGSGSVTTAGGTTGTLPKFTGAQTLGDSLLSESGSTMTVNGNLNLVTGNQFRVNGVQISSANLSNDANLAKLGSSQTFTGNTVAFQNGTNSTNAFNVQNQTGGRVLTVDTTGGQVLLGVGTVLDGTLVFSNVSNSNTVTILPGAPTANRTLTLPNASGVLCTDSGNCAGAGATLQTSYNFSVGGTTPKIKVNSTLMGVDIQDADTTIGANLFNIRASNGSGLGNVMFGISSTGQVTSQNASNSTTAFRLLTQGGTSVLTGDTQNGAVRLGQSGTLDGTLVFTNAANANAVTITAPTVTGARTISFGDESGTVCLRNSSSCGFAVSSGSGSYIQNQNASQQSSSNFWVSGAGRADTSFLAPLYDTASAVVLNIGTTNATAINLNQDVVIASGKTLTVNGISTFTANINIGANNIVGTTGNIDYTNFDVTGSTGAVTAGTYNGQTISSTASFTGSVAVTSTLNANGNATIGDANTDTLTISAVLQGGTPLVFEGTSADANETTFAITNPTADRTVTFGDEAGTVCLQGSTNCGFAVSSGSGNYIQNGTTAQASNFYVQAATSGSIAAIIRANVAGSGAILNLRNGADANVLTVSSTGAALFKNSTDSVSGFIIQNANSDAILTVDTSNAEIELGKAGPTGVAGKLVLNNASNANALTIQAGATSAGYTLTLPTSVGGTGDCLKASDSAGALTFGACAGGGGGLSATPTTTGTNTVQPATSAVVAMTLNGTNTGTAAQALIVNQAFAADAANINMTNTSGTQTNGLLINRNGASGTTTNGINITSTAGTLTNGIAFTGTIGVDIYRSSGTLLLQGGNGSGLGVAGTAISAVSGNGSNAVTTTAGAGGATTLTTGTGGNATSSGTGGAGGNFTITAGNGGTSATGTAGAGGVITLQPGIGGVGGTADGTTGRVQIGSSTTNATTNVFALDSSNVASESAFNAGQNVNGAMYYNTNLGKFRCYEGGTWKDCIQSGGASGTLQAAYTASTGSTTPEIKLDTTRTTLDIQNADSALTNHLLAVRASNGSGLGNLLFNVHSSGTVGINMGTTSTAPVYDLTFGNGAARTLGVATAASGAGNSITVRGGTGTTNNANGSAILTGGGSTAASFTAGGGTSNATDDVGGNAIMQGGTGGGTISAFGGMYDAGGGLQDGGSIQLTPGAGSGGGFDGAVIVEPIANSMSTFIVRQSDDTTVMRIDTLVPRVTLGAISLDDTGALLVLDGKTGSTDPSGALGAMYYNIGQGKFRCYEKNGWRDCMASARSEYHYIHEMIGTTTENNGGFYSSLGGLFLGGVVSGTTGHPGIVQLSTGTTSASGAAGFGANDTGASFLLGGGDYYKYEAMVRIPTLPTSGQNSVVRAGLYDGSSSGDGTDGCFFRYTNGTNSNRWQAICQNNATQSVCNSTSTPAANTWYRLTIEVDSTGSAADFYVNGTNICTVNSQIPTAAGRNVSTNLTIIKSVGTGTATTMDVDYSETLIQFGALR
jgi:fibronectin-binding autotransporter adhesin